MESTIIKREDPFPPQQLYELVKKIKEKKTLYGTNFVNRARKEKLLDDEVMVKASEVFSQVDALDQGQIDAQAAQKGFQTLGMSIRVTQVRELMSVLGAKEHVGEESFLLIFETWWRAKTSLQVAPETYGQEWRGNCSLRDSGIPDYRAENDKHCPFTKTTKFKRKMMMIRQVKEKPDERNVKQGPKPALLEQTLDKSRGVAETPPGFYPSTSRGVMFQHFDASDGDELVEVRVLKLILHREALLESLKKLLKGRVAEAKRIRRKANMHHLMEHQSSAGGDVAYQSASFVSTEDRCWNDPSGSLIFSPERSDERCIDMLLMLQEASCNVVEAISQWRIKARAPLPFVYNGKNYLLKMTRDSNFLQRDKQLARAYEAYLIQTSSNNTRSEPGADELKKTRPASSGGNASRIDNTHTIGLLRFSFARNPFLAATPLPAVENLTPRSLKSLQTWISSPSLQRFPGSQPSVPAGALARPSTTPIPGSRNRREEVSGISKGEAASQLVLLEEALQRNSLYSPTTDPVTSLTFTSPFQNSKARPKTSPFFTNGAETADALTLPGLRDTTPWDSWEGVERESKMRRTAMERRRVYSTSPKRFHEPKRTRIEPISRCAHKSGPRTKRQIEAELCLKKLSNMESDIARSEEYISLLERDIEMRRRNIEKLTWPDRSHDGSLLQLSHSSLKSPKVGYIVALSQMQLVRLRRRITKLISDKKLTYNVPEKSTDLDPETVFRMLDTTHHGLLGNGGMQMALQNLGLVCSPQDTKGLLGTLDTEGSGTISIEEFVELFRLIVSCCDFSGGNEGRTDQSTPNSKKPRFAENERAGMGSQLHVGRVLRIKKQRKELERRKEELKMKRKERYDYMNKNANKFASTALSRAKAEVSHPARVNTLGVSPVVKALFRDTIKTRDEIKQRKRCENSASLKTASRNSNKSMASPQRKTKPEIATKAERLGAEEQQQDAELKPGAVETGDTHQSNFQSSESLENSVPESASRVIAGKPLDEQNNSESIKTSSEEHASATDELGNIVQGVNFFASLDDASFRNDEEANKAYMIRGCALAVAVSSISAAYRTFSTRPGTREEISEPSIDAEGQQRLVSLDKFADIFVRNCLSLAIGKEDKIRAGAVAEARTRSKGILRQDSELVSREYTTEKTRLRHAAAKRDAKAFLRLFGAHALLINSVMQNARPSSKGSAAGGTLNGNSVPQNARAPKASTAGIVFSNAYRDTVIAKPKEIAESKDKLKELAVIRDIRPTIIKKGRYTDADATIVSRHRNAHEYNDTASIRKTVIKREAIARPRDAVFTEFEVVISGIQHKVQGRELDNGKVALIVEDEYLNRRPYELDMKFLSDLLNMSSSLSNVYASSQREGKVMLVQKAASCLEFVYSGKDRRKKHLNLNIDILKKKYRRKSLPRRIKTSRKNKKANRFGVKRVKKRYTSAPTELPSMGKMKTDSE